jgi:hypothetical protein
MKVDTTSGGLVPVISGALWGGVQVRRTHCGEWTLLFRAGVTQLIQHNSELLFQAMNF